jgi:hypothetical protein
MTIKTKLMGVSILSIGIESNGEVIIPWFIADKKKQFRRFARVLADAIPGADAFDRSKQWAARMPDRKVNVLEFLNVIDTVHMALKDLNAAL